MKTVEDNIVAVKSKAFAIRCIRLYKYLKDEKKEHVLSLQMVRSGTSIGANVKEAIRGSSKADFRAKMDISLKEASETEYWLELLYEADYLNKKEYDSMMQDVQELLRLLVSIVKTARG